MAAPTSAGRNPVIFGATEQTYSGGIKVSRVEWDTATTFNNGVCAFREGGTASGNSVRPIILRAGAQTQAATISRDYGTWHRDLVLSTLSGGTVRVYMLP